MQVILDYFNVRLIDLWRYVILWLFLLMIYVPPLSLGQPKASTQNSVKQEGLRVKGDEALKLSLKKSSLPPSPDLEAAMVLEDALVPVILIKVDKSGEVISAQPIEGFSLLRQDAVTVAKGWRFAPHEKGEFLSSLRFDWNEMPRQRFSVELNQERVKQSPASWAAHCRLAIAYLTHTEIDGKELTQDERAFYYQQAENEAQRAVSLSPKSAIAHYGLGWIYEKTRRYAKALESYQQALALRPDFIEAYHRAAWTLCAQGGLVINRSATLAEADYLRGYAVGFRYNERWEQRQLKDGRIVHLPVENIYKPFKTQNLKIDPEKIAQAVKILEDSISALADIDVKWNALKTIAQIYRLSRQTEKAIQAQQQAFQVAEEIVKLTEGAVVEEIANIPIHYDLDRYLNEIAILYQSTEHYQEAAELFNQVLERKYNGGAVMEAEIRLAAVYLAMGRKDLAEKVSVTQRHKLDEFLKLHKADLNKAVMLHERALMEEALGRYKEAIELVKKAVKLYPDTHEPHVTLYRLYVKTGNDKMAEQELELIQQTAPYNVPIKNSR